MMLQRFGLSEDLRPDDGVAQSLVVKLRIKEIVLHGRIILIGHTDLAFMVAGGITFAGVSFRLNNDVFLMMMV